METLDTELELIASSLLPEETLSETSTVWPREIFIRNQSSQRSLQIQVRDGYPDRSVVTIGLRSSDFGREEATSWNATIEGYMNDWDSTDDFPLYQLLTTHLLALLTPTSEVASSSTALPPTISAQMSRPALHHALLTSHHLLSPTKRKNFIALASQLSLTGFSKVGHPGIYYAVGEREDLAEWVREVKSWNWLALRIRIGVEPLPEGAGSTGEEVGGRGKEDGARGGKGRGDWVELEKIGEAMEWMRERGRQHLLLDIGIGGG